MESIACWITLPISIITLILVLVLFVYIIKHKSKQKIIEDKITVLKRSKTKVKLTPEQKKENDKEYMWDNKHNKLVEATPQYLAYLKDTMGSRTKIVIDKSKKGRK